MQLRYDDDFVEAAVFIAASRSSLVPRRGRSAVFTLSASGATASWILMGALPHGVLRIFQE